MLLPISDLGYCDISNVGSTSQWLLTMVELTKEMIEEHYMVMCLLQ
jgi:hypothetical protein